MSVCAVGEEGNFCMPKDLITEVSYVFDLSFIPLFQVSLGLFVGY